jgi:hypothetical protein
MNTIQEKTHEINSSWQSKSQQDAPATGMQPAEQLK